jgi:vacuolar protein sorting-associated protein 35
MLPKTKTKTS